MDCWEREAGSATRFPTARVGCCFPLQTVRVLGGRTASPSMSGREGPAGERLLRPLRLPDCYRHSSTRGRHHRSPTGEGRHYRCHRSLRERVGHRSRRCVYLCRGLNEASERRLVGVVLAPGLMDDVSIPPTRTQLERRLAAHRRAAATHRRATLIHEEASAQAREVGDGARELRELRLAAAQVDGARLEDSRAEEAAAAIAALGANRRAPADGKEGVDGSSPSEGCSFFPAQTLFSFSGVTPTGVCGVHRASTARSKRRGA